MYDSVAVFAAGLQALDRSHKLKPINLSCEQETPWEDGTSLYNYLNAVRFFVIHAMNFEQKIISVQLNLFNDLFFSIKN